ncbi:hypothetical protein ACOME3_007916 [Neoechinorhynchus agilis]
MLFVTQLLWILVLLNQSKGKPDGKCEMTYNIADIIKINCDFSSSHSVNILSNLIDVIHGADETHVYVLFLSGVSIDDIPINLKLIFPNLTYLFVKHYNANPFYQSIDFISNVKAVYVTQMDIPNISLHNECLTKELHLTESNIIHLDNKLGTMLPQLEILDLRRNHLSTLDELVDFCKLRELYIDHNLIETLWLSSRSCFNSLEILSALDNHIFAVNIEHRLKLCNLKEIHISLLALIDYGMQDLQKISSMETITIENSVDHRYDASKWNDTLNNLQTLKFLDGHLKAFPRGGQLTNKTIRIMSLASNSIVKIVQSDFSHWRGLQSLDLANNQLKSIPDDAFIFLENLNVLNLTGNKLSVDIVLPPLRKLYSSFLVSLNKTSFVWIDTKIKENLALINSTLSGAQMSHEGIVSSLLDHFSTFFIPSINYPYEWKGKRTVEKRPKEEISSPVSSRNELKKAVALNRNFTIPKLFYFGIGR